ncbi:hypothetical protein DSECCO2_450070 [anaerobic digester metagenome]
MSSENRFSPECGLSGLIRECQVRTWTSDCIGNGRYPAVLRRDEHAHRAGHVRLVRGEGVLHRPGHRRDGRLVEDAVRAREDLHQEVEVGDAPLDERHPGVIEEVLDVHPPPGGEVVDDDDVVVLR